jgi:hypothetical protein
VNLVRDRLQLRLELQSFSQIFLADRLALKYRAHIDLTLSIPDPPLSAAADPVPHPAGRQHQNSNTWLF